MTRNDVRRVNEWQKVYYEASFKASSTGAISLNKTGYFTNFFYRLRQRLHDLDRSGGLRAAVEDLHREWLGDLGGRVVLNLGCFSGNSLSTLLAEKGAIYRGVDLSEQAAGELNRKLATLNCNDAQAIALDILDNGFPSEFFDLVYARSVLHHFRDLNMICDELKRILRPGGIVITYDPLQTEPINRLARSVYRPFQSDRAREWPFTRASIRTLENHFEIADMMGVWGFAKLLFLCRYYCSDGALQSPRADGGVAQTESSRENAGRWHATILVRKPCLDDVENNRRVENSVEAAGPLSGPALRL